MRGWFQLCFCAMTSSPTFSWSRGLVCFDHCFSAFMVLCPRGNSLASTTFIHSSLRNGRKSRSSLLYGAFAGDSLVFRSGVFLSLGKVLNTAALSREPLAYTLSCSILLAIFTISSALALAWGSPLNWSWSMDSSFLTMSQVTDLITSSMDDTPTSPWLGLARRTHPPNVVPMAPKILSRVSFVKVSSGPFVSIWASNSVMSCVITFGLVCVSDQGGIKYFTSWEPIEPPNILPESMICTHSD